jgi:NAD(P)-dependent dehydrogenase (short-subunit alcohol dehydrogenase family)
MITKGGREAITRSLASEYSKEHIRFNAVAPSASDASTLRLAPIGIFPASLATLSACSTAICQSRAVETK